MEVLAASISGGRFPYQLAALIKLCQRGYKPKLSFGGSGGAVVIYCAAAAQWKPSGIERVGKALHYSFFIEDHDRAVRAVIPDCAYNYFQGSMYKTSRRSNELLETYFTSGRLVENEIWIAAVNEGSRSSALFCNKTYEGALLKGERLKRQLHSYEPIRYMGGCLKKATKALTATAAIPMIIEPVDIDGDFYVDCGVSYGSALTPMSDELLTIARNKGMHITYLSGFNVQYTKVSKTVREGNGNIGDHLKTIPSHVVRSIVENDRNQARSIIADVCCPEPLFREFHIDDLDEVLRIKSQSSSTLIEIYPECEESIDVFTFNGEDVIEFVDEHMSDLRIRMWYSQT